MQQHTETRLLFGGIDSDTMPQFIDDKAMLNAINVRTTINNDQTTGAVEFIAGNDFVGNFGDGTQFYQLLGKCTDEEKEVEYLFFHSALQFARKPAIYRYDKKLNAISLFFDDSNVVGGLGFIAGSFISARAANGLLIWTDGSVAGIRQLNTNRTYTGQITQDELSLIIEPGHVPLIQQRQDNPAVTTQIQEQPLQFTYRFINQLNNTSVLAPYSLTALPVRQSALTASTSAGNVIDIKMDFDQKIPDDWKIVEFVARYINSNTFFVIRQWSKLVAADVAAVNAHNAGTTQLSYLGWTGTQIFTIDAATSAKQFDAVPITANRVELADNRLLVAGDLEGYDTPIAKPTYSISIPTFTTGTPASNSATAYLLWCPTSETRSPTPSGFDNLCYYAIVTRYAGINYWILPQEDFGSGSFWLRPVNGFTGFPISWGMRSPEVMWKMPKHIPLSAMIPLKQQGDADLDKAFTITSIAEIRISILEEILQLKPSWTSINDADSFIIDGAGSFNVTVDPGESGTGGELRALAPNNIYKLGIQYYDGALRKSGVLPLQDVTLPAYGPFDRILSEQIDFTISPSAGIPPSWSKYYSVTFSKNQKAIRLVNFSSNVIKVVIKNAAGDTKYLGHQNLTAPPADYTVYGLAIPFFSAIQYGYGYSFNNGDFVEIVGDTGTANTSVISGPILEFTNDYLIIGYDSSKLSELDNVVSDAGPGLTATQIGSTASALVVIDGATLSQGDVFATLYNQPQNDTNTYEVARFGPVLTSVGGLIHGAFYDSGTLTTTILGDMYTQKRVGDTGGFTGFSITTFDKNNLFAVNDLGRITLTDTIGQKNLPTIIRWSNTNIPGTNTNGYATFDAPDYVIVDQTTGPITMIILTTKGVQEAAQLVITCTAGSYVALVGKQQIVDSGQNTAFTSTTAQVIGTINPIQGNWGCQSPRSVVQFQGHVWWVDWINQSAIEFNSSGATKISGFKTNRLWKLLCSRLTTQSDVNFIKAAVNPYSSEVLFTIPAPNATSKAVLPTTTLENPLDCYYNKAYTYIFNYGENAWKPIYQSDKEFFHIGWDLYSIKNAAFNGDFAKLYHEMNGQPGVYYGANQNAMIVVPFNSQYPMVKSPLTIRVSTDRPPDQTWLVSQDGNAQQVAGSSDYIMREGDAQAAILRDRLSNNASSAPQWAVAGINGVRLKGKAIVAVLIWFPENGPFTASSVTLEYQQASGH